MACNRTRPTHYIVPADYHGWVRITYNIEQGLDLPVEDGFTLARIDYFRRMRVRNKMNPSWDGSDFYSQDASGKRTRLMTTGPDRHIWATEKISDHDGDRESFFVGDQNQFSRGLNTGAGLDGFAITPPSTVTDLPQPDIQNNTHMPITIPK